MNKYDLAYLYGFYTGDGYFTYGRTGFDTISPNIARKLFGMLSALSSKSPVIEVYGDETKFSGLDGRKLIYPKRNQKHSDYVKIRIDDVKFAIWLSNSLSKFIKGLKNVSESEQLAFLKGFCDAEASVSPDASVQIDLAKNNIKVLKIVKSLLDNNRIENILKIYSSKCRLVVLGGIKNLGNLKKFQRKIGFEIPEKQISLKIVLKVYSNPRDERSPSKLAQKVLLFLHDKKACNIFSLMLGTNSKYTNLRRALNLLLENGKIRQFRNGKKLLVESRS